MRATRLAKRFRSHGARAIRPLLVALGCAGTMLSCNAIFGVDRFDKGAATTGAGGNIVATGGTGGAGGATAMAGGGPTGGAGGTGMPECMFDGDCDDDGDSCTDEVCDAGACQRIDNAGTCGLFYGGRALFGPFPVNGGTSDAIAIGPYHPNREIWCLIFGRTTDEFNDMAMTTVSIGGVNLTQTTLTPEGLNVGFPAVFGGWFGRMASYRLAASEQNDAGLLDQVSATLTLSAADESDQYGLYVWYYYAPSKRLFRGIKGNHVSDLDIVMSRTIAPNMALAADVDAINSSTYSTADILVFGLSMATRGNEPPSMASSNPFGGASLVQNAGNANAAAGSGYIHDYLPSGSETWSAITAMHPGANGVAMHVVTAAYW